MEIPVREGELIAGKYAIERVIGDGGMGVVVAARHLELGERVALKFLLPEAAKNPEACQRFVREARAAARIKGEHVARVLDVGTRDDDGTPFIVMEYLDGADLGRVVETRGPLPVAEAVHYVLQACEAVAQAHALGIVHRDLKPANLFLTTNPDGSPLVKVLDFGISKSPSIFARTLSPSITTVNASMGTPQYMSPEQARDAGKVDARSDLWALGAILYELLAGKPAFDADSVPALVMMIATEEPPALESLRPDVPVALAAVVRRCMQKSRDERFGDVAALARALEAFAPEEARPSVARIARILGHDSLPPPTIIESAPGAPGRRPRWLSVAFAMAPILVFAAFVGSKRWSTPSAITVVERAPAKAAPARAQPPATTSPTALAPVTSGTKLADVAATPRAASASAPPSAARASAPAGTRSFDHASAAAKLLDAADRASACSRIDAPSGAGRATITFSPDGSVRRVALPAPFAGSPNDACLRDAFLPVRVPPFRGAAPALEQRFRVVSPNEPGILTFQSNVPAEVALDGRPLGATPKSVTTAPGTHTVVFVHADLGQKEQAVTLAPGQDKTVRATFLPAAAEQP